MMPKWGNKEYTTTGPRRRSPSDLDDSPWLSRRTARYEISPYDRHPNAQAHARVADLWPSISLSQRADDAAPTRSKCQTAM